MQLKILMLEDSQHEAEFIEKVLRKEKIDFISKSVEFADNYVNTKIIDNDVINAQRIFRQETEMKKTEDTLRQHEACLRTIFDNTEISYILLDHELRIISFNSIASRNYTEMLGNPLREKAFIGNYIFETPKEASLEMYRRVINGECLQNDGSYLRNDGNICWYSSKLSPVKNRHNVIVGMIISMQDITSTKLAELEKERMMSDIAERNKELEQFAYIVSHNLRAPLANVMALSDAMVNCKLSVNEKKNMLEGLTGSVQKLENVVLDLNQVLNSKRQLSEQKEKIYFSNIVDEIKIQIRPLVRKQNVRIVTDFNFADEVVTIKSYLYGIFYNLVSNSIKFQKPGVAPVIEIRSRRHGEKIMILFKDNGMGIDLPKNMDRVFGLYKRFHTHVEGKGVGLYMCKVLAEALGGKINLKSELNEGTVITVELPAL